jgi:hypothetical protein
MKIHLQGVGCPRAASPSPLFPRCTDVCAASCVSPPTPLLRAQDRCLGIQGVYRISFALAVFFLAMAVLAK